LGDHEMRLDARRMSGRVAISLVIAVFAYLGLLFGGNLVIGPTRGPNSVSSSSKDGQPLQLGDLRLVTGRAGLGDRRGLRSPRRPANRAGTAGRRAGRGQ